MSPSAEPAYALVSIIIPTRGRPDLLMRAVRSALAQTWVALEVIVIVDGPDDATDVALANLQEPRLRVVRNAKPWGPGIARNLAARHACGAWIAFLDDDDQWLPEKLACQLAGRDVDQPVVLSCRCRVEFPGEARVWPVRLPLPHERLDLYLFDRGIAAPEPYIATPTLVMPRWLFERTGFGETRQHEDTTLLLRAQAQGASLVMVPEVLVVVRAGGADSLGMVYPWFHATEWLDEVRPLLTRRGYSGFCLIAAASVAARQGAWKALARLARQSIKHGAPTLSQWLQFAAICIVPRSIRQMIRSSG